MANDTLIAIGEALIDFIPDKSDCEFYEVTGFSPAVGGAYAFTKSARAFAPSLNVKAVDTTGAGDGFIGSLLWKLKQLGVSADSIDKLSETDIRQMLEFSNKFCAISVQSAGAISSYPTFEEIKNTEL